MISVVVQEAKGVCLVRNENTHSKMSSERLDRVKACARRAEKESLRSTTVVPGEHVGCGVDIAMVFLGENDKPVLYFGRVVACYSKVKGREEIID